LRYYVKNPNPLSLANTNSTGHWSGNSTNGYTDTVPLNSSYSAPTASDLDTAARAATPPTVTTGSADTFAYSVDSSGNTAGCTINSDGSGLAETSGGSCKVNVSATNSDGFYNNATQTLTLTITPPQAVITITSSKPTNPVIGTSPYTPTATTTSSGTVVIAVSTSSTCSISGGVVTFLHAGPCTITYNDTGDSSHSAATQVTETINVAKLTAVITADTAPTNAATGLTFNSTSTSTSSNTPTVGSSTPLICTVSNNVVTYIATGTCTLTYNDAGTSDYSAATQVIISFQVAKGSATITIGTQPDSSSYRLGSYTPAPTSNSGDSVTITSSTLSVCTVSNGVVSYLTTGTCTLTYSDAGNSNFNAAPNVVQNITVLKTQAVITLGTSAPSSPALNSTYTPAATSTSSDSVVLVSTTTGVCTVASGVVTFLHPGTCTLTFDDLGNANFSLADTLTVDITVPKLANSITVTSTAPSGPVVGATYTPAATATSGLAVAVSTSTSDICTVNAGVVTFNHVGTCVVTFDEPGNATYDVASTQTQSITVNQATAVISFNNAQPDHVYVGGSYDPSAVSTSSDSVVQATTTPQVCSVANGVIYFLTLGTCTVTYDDAGNADYLAATTATQTFTVEVINVTYDANGATGNVPLDVNTYITATLVHVLGNFGTPQLTRTGYIFTGWCTTNTSFTTCTDGTFYASGIQFSVASPVVLYSQWALAVPTITLTVGPTTGVTGVPLVLSPSIGTNTGATYTVANGSARGCVMSHNVISATTSGTCIVTFTRDGTTVTQTITFGAPHVAPGAVFAQTFFGDSKVLLTAQSVTTLTNVALEIIAKHLKVISVTGYASAKGSPTFNLKLSIQRANNVTNFLKALLKAAGYTGVKFTVSGQGASRANSLYAMNREVVVRG